MKPARFMLLSSENVTYLSELARAMGLSVSQLYRVREGKRGVNQEFITGTSKAFPGLAHDEVFYVVPEPPDE